MDTRHVEMSQPDFDQLQDSLEAHGDAGELLPQLLLSSSRSSGGGVAFLDVMQSIVLPAPDWHKGRSLK